MVVFWTQGMPELPRGRRSAPFSAFPPLPSFYKAPEHILIRIPERQGPQIPNRHHTAGWKDEVNDAIRHYQQY